jgi:hypothetical protein
MENSYIRKYFSFSRAFILVVLVYMAFGGMQARAQIAPSDFVYTANSIHISFFGEYDVLIIPASGGYDLYIESIPSGFSATVPASANSLNFVVPAAGTYRVALRPTVVGGNPAFHRIAFGPASMAGTVLSVEQWGTALGRV